MQPVVAPYEACLMDFCTPDSIQRRALRLPHHTLGNYVKMKGCFAAMTVIDEDVCRNLDLHISTKHYL